MVSDRDLTNGRQISSKRTLFFNITSVVFFVLVCAALVRAGLAAAAGRADETLSAESLRILTALLIASALNLWFCLPLKKVVIGRDGLIVSNYLRRANIPYDNVKSIRQAYGLTVTLVKIKSL